MGGWRPRRSNKAFRESLRTLIDAISSDASTLHTFLAKVFSGIILQLIINSFYNIMEFGVLKNHNIQIFYAV